MKLRLPRLHQPSTASPARQRTFAGEPDYAADLGNQGLALLQLGRLAEACAALEAAIALAPMRARAYHHLALAKQFERGDPLIPAMELLTLESSPLEAEERVYAHFALGKAYADICDVERAFRHVSAGCALKRGQFRYDEAEALGALQRTQATCGGEFLARHHGCGDPSPVPVFVVGMARSGAALVEQILASHPDVYGAGEINDFDMAGADLGGAAGLAFHLPEMASQMSGEDFRGLGAQYLRRIAAGARPESRIVNKTPENFRFAGLIALALPNARILHVRRDPVDACFSCFSTLFAEDLPYAYDLAELGRYYRAYEALMDHWRAALPRGMMLDVQYEEVVGDLEGQARRLLDHCGLDWDARCLDFHRNARRVRTASLAQVRRPVYASSIGRSRPYEAYLAPLLAALGVPPGADPGRAAPDPSPSSVMAA